MSTTRSQLRFTVLSSASEATPDLDALPLAGVGEIYDDIVELPALTGLRSVETYREYDRRKLQWLAEHPEASSKEYEWYCEKIARDLWL